jgi:geranylgeranyl reductase family protein
MAAGSPLLPDVPAPLPATSRPPIELEVAVVGAGPAGAAAALELASRGVKVGLIEKAVPPRYKTCGGGVLRRALDLLPIDVSPAVERECHAAEIIHHGPALRFVSERAQPIVSMVMRDQFDHLIGSAAVQRGAQLLAGTTVQDVDVGADGVRLLTSAGEIRARFVIAADGAQSVVARKTGRREIREVFPALECEVTLPAAEMAPLMRTARFDFGLVTAGYGWVFPKRTHLSIGVGTTRRGAANLPEAYREYLRVLGVGPPLREERHGYLIPCRPREGMFDVPRVLFAGDAAGLADPVTAEGITAGILSGQLAARAIVAGGFEALAVGRIFRATLERELLGELRLARGLAWVLYDCPRLRVGLLTRYGPQMSELMTRIVTGETTYRAVLQRPANYLKLFRRAA